MPGLRPSSFILPLLLAACSAPPLATPSLAPRTAESIDPRLPVGGPVPAGPAEAGLTARLAELVGQARSGDAAFAAAAGEAEQLAASAGERESESWTVAQQAVSVAVAARGPTSRALGDIDAIAASRLDQAGGILPGDLAAIDAAAAEVAAIDRRQTERLNALQARLGG